MKYNAYIVLYKKQRKNSVALVRKRTFKILMVCQVVI
jgi:hypothetical protein